MDHIPFSSVDSEHYREMILTANPQIKPYLVSRKTLRAWIQRDCDVARAQVKQRLNDIRSNIHLSFNVWTSPGFVYAFLGIMAHFVVETEAGLQNYAVLLALKRVYDKHDAENIATLLLETIDEYDIAKIKPGQKVFVSMDSYKGQVFEATVSKIQPIMDNRLRSFEIEAIFISKPSNQRTAS